MDETTWLNAKLPMMLGVGLAVLAVVVLGVRFWSEQAFRNFNRATARKPGGEPPR